MEAADEQWYLFLGDTSLNSFLYHLPYASTGLDFSGIPELADTLPWVEVRANGDNSRWSCWLTRAPCSCTYKYGKRPWLPEPFPPWLSDLTDKIKVVSNLPDACSPNSVNCNWYPNRSTGLGWHADNEELFRTESAEVVIISLSLGATRTFEVWSRSQSRTYELPLHTGDLAIMSGFFQDHYDHRIAPEVGITGARYNFMWRFIVRHLCGLSDDVAPYRGYTPIGGDSSGS